MCVQTSLPLLWVHELCDLCELSFLLHVHTCPICVTQLKLIRAVIFKHLINDSWQVTLTLINANHLGWCGAACVKKKKKIHIYEFGRRLPNQDVNVLPAQWALPCNYTSTPKRVTLRIEHVRGSQWLYGVQRFRSHNDNLLFKNQSHPFFHHVQRWWTRLTSAVTLPRYR